MYVDIDIYIQIYQHLFFHSCQELPAGSRCTAKNAQVLGKRLSNLEMSKALQRMGRVGQSLLFWLLKGDIHRAPLKGIQNKNIYI